MKRPATKIVSSEHLVSDSSAELSELEYGLIMAGNAFNRWMVRCMSAAGAKDMTAVEVSLLHHVSHRERKKKLADICFVLNIEDTHVATYALKTDRPRLCEEREERQGSVLLRDRRGPRPA